MIRPDFEKWGQSAEDIRQLSLEAEHKRSRERFQALYMVGTKQYTASQWSLKAKRCKQTILSWVHDYNEVGPTAMTYQPSGGTQAKLRDDEKKRSLKRSNIVSR